MNKVINEIIDMDSWAYEKKNSNDKLIKTKKVDLEQSIESYKNEKIEGATLKVKEIEEKSKRLIEEKAAKEVVLEEKLLEEVKKQYSKIEKECVEEVFNNLFKVVR